jgi:hypothetical protein
VTGGRRLLVLGNAGFFFAFRRLSQAGSGKRQRRTTKDEGLTKLAMHNRE